MEKYSNKEKSISTEDILEALDRFGARSKTPSPVQGGSSETPQLSLLIDDPLNAQRLSIISADGSEVDSDYSSASSIIHVSDGQRNLEREWQMLFGSTAYFSKIRQHALEGKLRFSKFRSICWKVFLECLPEQKEEWIAKTTQLRNDYQELKTKHLFDPNKTKNRALDLSVFNPLSQDENSPWKQYFQDNELKSTIKQDLDRLFPEIEFFQRSRVKDMMLSILFCHAKKNEALSYKQGMHELLAPIVYVLNEDAKLSEHLEGSSLNIARFLMDPNYIEHDAFAMFVQLMDQTETWYLQLPSWGVPERNKFLDPHAEPFTDRDTLPCTAIVKKLNRIHEHMLRKYDPELWIHLKNLDITPQLYGLRWIRLLFGREFSMDEVLVLWDALFADGPLLDLVDYIYISMLESIRDKLLGGSYLVCMGYLMKFPRVYDDVNRYVRRALGLRQNKISSATRSSPRPSRPAAPRPIDSSGTVSERKKEGVKRPQSAFTSFTKRYQHFMEPTKQIAARTTSKLPTTEASRTNSFTEEELVPKGFRPARPVSVPAPETRDCADSGPQSSTPVKTMKSIANPLRGKLMTRPRTRSKIDYDELAQDHQRLQQQVSSLKSELDKIQGLYLYCGRKMDSYIDLLQDELANEEGVNDVVFLCLAGLKQVRDLLKGTLVFRGSTMEHECDFMEIDNNIASRLQVPSLRHQMHLENLPDGIPVPMLANFGHFENPSEETESSFITGKVDQMASGDYSGGFEDLNEKSSANTLKYNAEVSETIAVEGDSFEKRASDEYNSEDNHLKNDLHEYICNFDVEPRSSEVPVDSNSNIEGTEPDSFNDNSAVSSEVAHKTDKKPVQPDDDNQFPAVVHGDGSREMSSVADPLTNLMDDFNLEIQLQSWNSGYSSDIPGRCRPEGESPERDFVFVNCEGEAMSLPKPPRHPLENNQDDEFEENNP